MIMMTRTLSEKEEENNINRNNNNNLSDIFHLQHFYFELWEMRFYENDDKDVKREGRGKQQQ